MRQTIILASAILIFSACSDSSSADLKKSHNVSEKATSGKLDVDLDQSKIWWRGSKENEEHNGEISLKSGSLTVENGKVTGGNFTFDMNSIEVSDIPENEPVPRKRLIDHLKSDDFFETSTYPTANFVITGVRYSVGSRFFCTGDLTVKGVTQTIRFSADYENKSLEASTVIDRFRWGIGDPDNNSGVDKNIRIGVNIVVK